MPRASELTNPVRHATQARPDERLAGPGDTVA